MSAFAKRLFVAPRHGSCGQQETFVPNGVSFTVNTDDRTYPAGEQVHVTHVSAMGVSRSASVGQQMPSKPHVSAWFENSSGRHFNPGYAGDCSASQETVVERMKSDAALLKPGLWSRARFVSGSKLRLGRCG